MDKTCDIAIIGGGLASLAAALSLENSGKEIVLIRKAPGAAALSSGALELGESLERFPTQGWQEFSTVETNLSDILQRQAFHPLQVWRKSWGFEKLFSFLRQQVAHLTEHFPLRLAGDGNYPMALLNEMGTVHSTALAQESMAAGDLRGMKGARLLIVGIDGLASFRSKFLADSLREAEPDFFSSVDEGEISLPFLKSNASLSPFEVATALDREEGAQVLIKKLEQVLVHRKATHVLLPPVMGMVHTKEIFKLLEKATGCTCAETTAARSSVPGWRLSEAILRYFKFRGYDIWTGEVVGYEGQNRRITSLKIHSGPERMRLKTDRVILASGKFIGGGIQEREGQIREPIFGLPLFLQGKPVGEWGRRDLFSDQVKEDQAIFAAGVQVNERGQALGTQNEILWENLFASGRILSGSGVQRDRSASAISLISGGVVA